MEIFSKFLGLLSIAALILFPVLATSQRWGIGGESNIRLIQEAEQCGPERRDSAGRCVMSTRTAGRRRSFFDGGSGRGK